MRRNWSEREGDPDLAEAGPKHSKSKEHNKKKQGVPKAGRRAGTYLVPPGRNTGDGERREERRAEQPQETSRTPQPPQHPAVILLSRAVGWNPGYVCYPRPTLMLRVNCSPYSDGGFGWRSYPRGCVRPFPGVRRGSARGGGEETARGTLLLAICY
jgi:hypothetical protein